MAKLAAEFSAGQPRHTVGATGQRVASVAVGDHPGLFGRGTSGEGCDAEDLRLPGVQAELLDEGDTIVDADEYIRDGVEQAGLAVPGVFGTAWTARLPGNRPVWQSLRIEAAGGEPALKLGAAGDALAAGHDLATPEPGRLPPSLPGAPALPSCSPPALSLSR